MIEEHCDEDCDDWKGLWWLKKIAMIEKDCDNWKKIVIKKIHACNRMNFSSNVNEVIKAVLNSLFFLRKDFAHTKSTKTSKSTKALRRTKQKHKTLQADKNKKCA